MHLDAPICGAGDHHSLAETLHVEKAAHIPFVLFEDSSFALFGPPVGTVSIDFPSQDLSITEPCKEQTSLGDDQTAAGCGSS